MGSEEINCFDGLKICAENYFKCLFLQWHTIFING